MAIIQQIAAKMVEKVLGMLETDGLANIGKTMALYKAWFVDLHHHG